MLFQGVTAENGSASPSAIAYHARRPNVDERRQNECDYIDGKLIWSESPKVTRDGRETDADLSKIAQDEASCDSMD